MNISDRKTIAVDFDGTIVEDKYPDIGKPMLFAFETLLKLQQEGHKLILWTYRSGNSLEEAVKFCSSHGVEFYAVNKNFADEIFDENAPRKLKADLFIDDRNIGGFLGWGKIYQLINPSSNPMNVKTPEKKSFWGFKK